MKKKTIILMIILISISITACSDKIGKSNILTETELTDREKIFLSMSNSKYFVFDFITDSNYNWLEVWVETYESGEKGSVAAQLSSSLSESKDGLIFIGAKEDKEMNSDWTISVKSGGGVGTSTSTYAYTGEMNSAVATIWGTNTMEMIDISHGVTTLASIGYKGQDKDTAMRSLSDEFYKNPDEHLEEIENYDLVYLVRCKFSRGEAHPQ